MQTGRSKRGSIGQTEEANKRPKITFPPVAREEDDKGEEQKHHDRLFNDQGSSEFTETQDVHMADEISESADTTSPNISDSSKQPTMNADGKDSSASAAQRDKNENASQDDTEFNPFDGMTQAEINRQISMLNAYSREKAMDTTQITNLDVTRTELASKIEDDTERIRAQFEALSPQFPAQSNFPPVSESFQSTMPPHLMSPGYRGASSRSAHHPQLVLPSITLSNDPIPPLQRKGYGELRRNRETRSIPQHHSLPTSPSTKDFQHLPKSSGHSPQLGNSPRAATPIANLPNHPTLEVSRTSSTPLWDLPPPKRADPHTEALVKDLRERMLSDGYTASQTTRKPSSRSSAAPKVIDSTMVFSEADQMYHCRVPLAYTTCNPNTQPLSTTDPFFKSFPSHPDQVTLIPHLSRTPHPTAVKDSTGKRSGWTNLDKNWHKIYTDRHHRGEEYGDEYGDDTDTDEDEHM